MATPSQLLPVITELLTTAKPRETKSKFDALLTSASANAQYHRQRAATRNCSLATIAIEQPGQVVDPSTDELTMYFGMGLALQQANNALTVPGLTEQERVVAIELAGKIKRLLQKQWKDGNKTEGTRLYDALRSLG